MWCLVSDGTGGTSRHLFPASAPDHELAGRHLKGSSIRKRQSARLPEELPLAPAPKRLRQPESPPEKLEEASPGEPEPATRYLELAGRPELAFFNEHIVDIIKHRDRLQGTGDRFPSAIPGTAPPGWEDVSLWTDLSTPLAGRAFR